MLRKKQWLFLSVSILLTVGVHAQDNSPFSRYGLGNSYSNQNVRYLGIGGMTAALGSQQALNTDNPASYGSLFTMGPRGGLATFDLGFNIDSRSLKSINPAGTYTSNNFTPSYFSIGIPLAKSGFGVVFGLKPITRINYSVIENNTINVSGFPDSVKNFNTIYSGSGGLNQVFLGLGKKIGNLSLGVNLGYDFGKKDIQTQTVFDSAYGAGTDVNQIPTKGSISDVHTSFGGFVWEGGLQYNLKLSQKTDEETKIINTSILTFGATASIKQNIKSKESSSFFTYYAQDPDNPVAQDTVNTTAETKGTITLPLDYKIGLMYNNYQAGLEKWGLGAEYNSTSWGSDFRVNGQPEPAFADSWMLRGGVYISPSPLRGTSFFSRAKYSVGFYTGQDNFVFDNQDYKIQAVTLGMGFSLRNYNRLSNQYSMINTSLEFGRRGGKDNNVTESFIKFSVGFSLSDIWLTKRRYQ